MFLLLLCALLGLGSVTIEGCDIDLHGESGTFSMNGTTGRPFYCSWTIGKGLYNINFIVIKFKPFELGFSCYYNWTYVEVADASYESKVRSCGGWWPFEVLIRNRPAVVRYYSKNIWSQLPRINVSFYIITGRLSVLPAKSWNPAVKQSKPGEVTINWDPLTLPSKSYIVVPLYNVTATSEPILYIIERRNEKSTAAVEYLKPATSYSFKVVAFDSLNTSGPLIISNTTAVLTTNETVRLMGGELSNEGRVEVYKFGFWHKMCGIYLFFNYNSNVSNVVCRSLGMNSPNTKTMIGFQGNPFPIHFLKAYYCVGTETSLEECNHTAIDLPYKYKNDSFHQLSVVCGQPPVFQQNITDMAGVITSPGYPLFMMQADYRWIFTPNVTHGIMVVYFDELNLRKYRGTSSVYIQQSGNLYKKDEYDKSVEVLGLPCQIKFYSSFSTRYWWGNKSGMKARYFAYSKLETELKNWTMSLSSQRYDKITANLTEITVTGYNISGFVLRCNSTQDWAKETFKKFGESDTTSVTFDGLIGYTNYDVFVFALLKKRENGTRRAYTRLKASITTPESTPRSPQRVYSTDITSNTAVVRWQQIPRKDAHGVLLGYIVQLYRLYTDNVKEIRTNDTSIVLTGLSPANKYVVNVRGYTAVGSGPYDYTYFSTKCGGTFENQLHGKIYLQHVPRWSTVSCIWRLVTPTPNTFVVLVLKSLKMQSSFRCRNNFVAIMDDNGNVQHKLCDSRHSMSFVSTGSTKIELYLRSVGWSNFYMLTNFFMFQNTLVPSVKSWKISSSTISSTSINVTWEEYPGIESVSKYVAICTANNYNKNTSSASTDGQNLRVVVQNMLKYTEYKVVVFAFLGNSSFVNLTNVNETMSKSQEVVIKTDEDAPSKPPQNVTARYLGSNTLVVSWKPVDSDFTNGIVVGYYIYYQVAWTNVGWEKEYIRSSQTYAYLKGLKDVTQYRIEMSAATKIGEGPRSRGLFIKTGCQQALHGELGIFSSPNYPRNYPSNVHCTWTISPQTPVDEIVVIFEHFDIEEGNNGNCSINDFVKVIHMFGNILSSAVCGKRSPFAVVSVPKTVIIILQSDGGLEKSGFQASYFLLSSGNDKDITLKVGNVNATAASLSWKSPSSSSINWFYVLYKRDEINENWKVEKTAALAVSIGGLLPSTQYTVKIIGNSSKMAYWSRAPVKFVTSHLPKTPPPEEKPSTRPAGSLNRMYSYGTREGDLTIPNTWEYWHRCFKINFNDDGFLFVNKRHYQIYICRNGVMRFDSSSYLHWPKVFGTSKYCYIDILAPYWSLADRQYSQVFYHVYSTEDNIVQSKKVLDQATSDVHLLKHHSSSSSNNFKASWVLVVTWDKLRHYTINSDTKDLRNTFQAVLITDGVLSFAMYNYPSNGIQWSAPTSNSFKNWKLFANDRGLPVVGWSAAGICMHFNADRSGTVNIGNIDNTIGRSVYWNQGRRMESTEPNDSTEQNDHLQGKWFFELYMHWEISKGEQKCKSWFKKEPDPRPYLEYLEPCPCTSRQAWFDERFTPLSGMKRWWSWWSNPRPCALSTFPSIDGWEQRCCYSHEPGQWGALIVGHPNGGYSHRFRMELSGDYIKHDSNGHKFCCIDSNLCHLFYQRRPSDDCSRYEPPEWSWMWGDPHFVTLDGKNYTFNGLGEYVMLDAKNGFFQLQSRTRLAKGEGTATIFCAAVMKEYNCSTVQLNLAKNGSMSVLIDGKLLDLTSLQNGSTTLNGSVVVARPQDNSFKATYPSGISVTLTESKAALSILVALPKSFKNHTKGLLGTWNGNKLDDFTKPDGDVLPNNATSREIHFEFGQKWQVNETNSLFTYEVNESVSTFSNTSFIPMFVDELRFANKTLEKQALAECNGDINCLFDAASTNDVSMGLDTKAVGSQLVNESAILSNSPPKFPNETTAILLSINTTKRIKVTVEDSDGDSVKFNVSGLPKGAIVRTNSSTVSVSWNVTMEKVNIEFIATDDKGAVSILRPIFHLCACHNGATCVQPQNEVQSQSDSRFKILPCQCRSGYTGQYCENDIDACSVNLNPCYPGVKCKDLPAPANESGYECGPCPPGFSGKGDSCEDIDECADSVNHGCSQFCYNTPGLFVCGCQDGYSLKSDGHSCEDVNECQPLADCMQKCENTPGSYQCSCHNDFKKDPSDPKKCIPKFPCKDGSHGCKDVCYETNKVATCACHMGYQLKPDKKSCADVNECKEGKDRCNQICYNKEGSYDCGCINGFRLGSDNVTCVDIDECLEWTFNCSVSLRCENTIGSYKCRCQEGLYWINNRCRELTTGEKKPTPQPPPKPPTPSKEDLRNSVNITIKQLNVSEWDLQLDLAFKKAVAREVNTFCVKNNICLQPKGRTRRSNSFITFTSNQVNLVGFPIKLSTVPPDSLNALVAFYVKYPPGVASNLSGSIDGDILVDIINGSLGNIGMDIGKTILSVSKYQMEVTTVFPTTSGILPEQSNPLFYIIGGSAGGAIVLIILLVLILRCCKRQTRKQQYKVEEVAVMDTIKCNQAIFFENPNAELEQK